MDGGPVDDQGDGVEVHDLTVGGPAKGSRATWLAAALCAVGLVGVLGLLGGLVTHAPRPGDPNGPHDPHDPHDPSTVARILPMPIDAQAPTDGKASRRLTVRATPARDLVDGQVVGVHGSGFQPFAEVGIVECLNTAQTRGVAACDLSGAGLSHADANGEVQGLARVRQTITVDGRPVDCATGNVDPDQWAYAVLGNHLHVPDYPATAFTCAFVIGQTADYDYSGGWPIALQGETFVSVSPPTTGATTTPTAAPETTTTTAVAPTTSTTTSSTTAPTSSVPGSSVPSSSVPGSSVPGSSVPGSSVPGSSVPGSTPPATGRIPSR